MVSDFDGMQSLEDFVHTTPVKRKRKAMPVEKPKKKKMKLKLEPQSTPIKKPVIIGNDFIAFFHINITKSQKFSLFLSKFMVYFNFICLINFRR